MSFLVSFLIGWNAMADVWSFADRELHISTSYQVQDYSLQLRDHNSGTDLYYKPNVEGVFIPRVSYKGIWALSWGFNTPVSESSVYLEGKTSYTDIRFDFSYHSFTVNTYYSQYRGLFLDNSVAVNPLLTSNDPKIQRPDMYSRSTGISLTWVWDEADFSLPNLYNQSERQEKRGGSFLFGGALSESVITADQSFIPANLQGQFDVLSNMRGSRFQTVSAKAGYGYAYAKKWFFGGAIMVGPGLTRRKFEYDTGQESDGWEPSGIGELLVSGGYNGDQFFASLRADWRQEFYIVTGSSSQINPQLAAVALNIGIHLDTLKFSL